MLFIRDSIDRCHDVAVGTGARIVHCCGFDSVPSDLGVLLLHLASRAEGTGDLQDTTLIMTALQGGISGETLASLMGQQAEVRASAQRRRLVSDPYALSPDRAAEPDLGDERDLDWIRYDSGLRTWMGPFAMAGINTRVVRRSNALQGWAYGPRVNDVAARHCPARAHEGWLRLSRDPARRSRSRSAGDPAGRLTQSWRYRRMRSPGESGGLAPA